MTYVPHHFTVWAEIPVRDLDRSIAFYNAVFKTELNKVEAGPNPMAMFPTVDNDGVAANLYPGEPSDDGKGPTVHLLSPDDLEAALPRVWEAGGKVLSDVIAIPGGKFAYCLDPDGNSIALFTK